MRYLGRVTLKGALVLAGENPAPASFELECYAVKGGLTHGSGDVEAADAALEWLVASHDVEFLAEDGHRLKLRLADRKAPPESGVATVVAAGDLPVVRNGVLAWAPAA